MGFFLLGRSADDKLSLLSARTFESRPEALTELSRITAEPDFTRWNDDVLLIDTETGTPVLLVRPAASSASSAPQAERAMPETLAELPEPGEFSAIADDELIVTPILAASVPVEPEPTAVEGQPTAAPEPPSTSEAGTSLRDAIARTTEHMEATGIVAPESIGPAEWAVEPRAEAAAEQPAEPTPAEPAAAEAIPDLPVETVAQPPVERAVEQVPEPTVEQPVETLPVIEASTEPVNAELDALLGQDQAPAIEPAPAWPTATPLVPEVVGAALPAEQEAPEPAVPAWPWDTPVAEPASIEHGAEAPAEEGADESVPLVLNETDAGPQVAEPVAEPVAEQDAFAPAQPQSTPPEPEAAVVDEPKPTSDFIELDTPAPDESAQPQSTDSSPPETPPEEDDVLPLSSYTCGDCVYVDTCPNRDQRLPKDCGSFQWK